jgi:TRAP transporter TAXI family solute receptor
MTTARARRQRSGRTLPVQCALCLLLVAAALALPRASAPAAAQPAALADTPGITIFRVGTGGLSGIYYPAGRALTDALMREWPRVCGADCPLPPLLAIAQRSSGSVSNARDLDAGRVEAALVQADVARWAVTGTGYFAGEMPKTALRAIGWLYPETLQIVARADSGVRRFADLRGKRVALDEPGSGTLATARVVLEAHGLSEADLEPLYLRLPDAVEALRAGRIDAFFAVLGAPSSLIAELAGERAIRLVPLAPEALGRILAREPALARTRLPAAVYPGTEAATTLQVKALLATHAGVDARLVRRVTTLLWHEGTLGLLARPLPEGYPVAPSAAVADLPLPLHSGALRFYTLIGQAP